MKKVLLILGIVLSVGIFANSQTTTVAVDDPPHPMSSPVLAVDDPPGPMMSQTVVAVEDPTGPMVSHPVVAVADPIGPMPVTYLG